MVMAGSALGPKVRLVSAFLLGVGLGWGLIRAGARVGLVVLCVHWRIGALVHWARGEARLARGGGQGARAAPVLVVHSERVVAQDDHVSGGAGRGVHWLGLALGLGLGLGLG